MENCIEISWKKITLEEYFFTTELKTALQHLKDGKGLTEEDYKAASNFLSTFSVSYGNWFHWPKTETFNAKILEDTAKMAEEIKELFEKKCYSKRISEILGIWEENIEIIKIFNYKTIVKTNSWFMVINMIDQKILIEWSSSFKCFQNFFIFEKWWESIAITDSWETIHLKKDYKILSIPSHLNYQTSIIYSNNIFYWTWYPVNQSFKGKKAIFLLNYTGTNETNEEYTLDGVNNFSYKTWWNYILYFNEKTKNYNIACLDVTNDKGNYIRKVLHWIEIELEISWNSRSWRIKLKNWLKIYKLYSIAPLLNLKPDEIFWEELNNIPKDSIIEAVKNEKWKLEVFLITPAEDNKTTKKKLNIEWGNINFFEYWQDHYISADR